MKKTILLAAVVIAAVSCGTSEITKVSGSFPADATETQVQIVAGQTDTTIALQDGKFSIDLPTDITAFAYAIADGRKVQFVADGSKININFEDGVAISSSKKGVHSRYAAFQEWDDQFTNDYRAKVSAEGLTDEDKEAMYKEAAKDYSAHLVELVRANPDNVLGLMALSNIDLEDDEMLALIEGLSKELQENPRIVAMKKALDASSKTAEGMMFTDFEVDGVKFSDFIGKGKYVLVDFWASWCGPCRREMPNLRAVYEKFHGDKFDMLSVAVWDKLEDTIKAAQEENIVWNQIVNAQRIPTELYGITGIPHIILFGPDGTILKRNLRGEAIGEAVAEALAE